MNKITLDSAVTLAIAQLGYEFSAYEVTKAVSDMVNAGRYKISGLTTAYGQPQNIKHTKIKRVIEGMYTSGECDRRVIDNTQYYTYRSNLPTAIVDLVIGTLISNIGSNIKPSKIKLDDPLNKYISNELDWVDYSLVFEHELYKMREICFCVPIKDYIKITKFSVRDFIYYFSRILCRYVEHFDCLRMLTTITVDPKLLINHSINTKYGQCNKTSTIEGYIISRQAVGVNPKLCNIQKHLYRKNIKTRIIDIYNSVCDLGYTCNPYTKLFSNWSVNYK